MLALSTEKMGYEPRNSVGLYKLGGKKVNRISLRASKKGKQPCYPLDLSPVRPVSAF